MIEWVRLAAENELDRSGPSLRILEVKLASWRSVP